MLFVLTRDKYRTFIRVGVHKDPVCISAQNASTCVDRRHSHCQLFNIECVDTSALQFEILSLCKCRFVNDTAE